MKLTKTERWILFNQFQILEKLGKYKFADTETCRRTAEALRCGYELDYKNLSGHVCDDPDVLSESDCVEVLKILSMYDHLQHSYDKLGANSSGDDLDVVFPGFDGNNEGSLHAYARYVVGPERFASLRSRHNDLNSHMPYLESYRVMLERWKNIQARSRGLLSAADIAEILKRD